VEKRESIEKVARRGNGAKSGLKCLISVPLLKKGVISPPCFKGGKGAGELEPSTKKKKLGGAMKSREELLAKYRIGGQQLKKETPKPHSAMCPGAGKSVGRGDGKELSAAEIVIKSETPEKGRATTAEFHR